jgi:hypothetical protein
MVLGVRDEPEIDETCERDGGKMKTFTYSP